MFNLKQGDKIRIRGGRFMTDNIIELQKQMLECYPMSDNYDLNAEKVTKIPLSEIKSLGIAFKPIVSAIQSVTTGQGGSGLYFVNTFGKRMFNSKNTAGFIGSLKDTEGAVGGGQAVMTQIPLDPTLLCVAAAVMAIEKKLDDIHETQKDILSFLEDQQRAKLETDLDMLNEAMVDYKKYYNNDKFINAQYHFTHNIRKETAESIKLYQKQIVNKTKKRSVIHSDLITVQKVEEIYKQMKDYQLALYLYCYSYLLEIMMLKSFEKEKLKDVLHLMENEIFKYRQLYTDVYEVLNSYSEASVEKVLVNGLGQVTKIAGTSLAKVPLLSKSLIDETLTEAGEKLLNHQSKKVTESFEHLMNTQTNMFQPFVKNINLLLELNSQQTEYLFDKEYVYIKINEI